MPERNHFLVVIKKMLLFKLVLVENKRIRQEEEIRIKQKRKSHRNE